MPPTEPAGLGELQIHAAVNSPTIATLVVEVTAADLSDPLVFNFALSDAGMASGTITVPAGAGRTITVRAYDVGGIQTHEGRATVDIRRGPNPLVRITLRPLTGDQPIEILLGSFTVKVQPGEAILPVGQTLELAAVVTDVDGTVVETTVKDLEWATDAPAVAIITATSLDGRVVRVSGRIPGVVRIAASFGGAAGAARLTVLDLAEVIGESSVEVPRSDACGRPDGRFCESKVGNVITDAMRATYGTDFAIHNAGGIRASLTCPVVDDAFDFCPPFTPPPWKITRGQVLSVLPFGNVVVTVDVSGAELKAILENGVSTMPMASGRFPQVSGLCFTYDIEAPAGARVTGAVRQVADGSCTGAAVDLTAASTYVIVENDFMAGGGDGYPNFTSRVTVRDRDHEVVSAHIAAHTPIRPAIQGRILCKDPNPGSGNDCPAILAP